jgi:hypothetical protein
MHVAVRGMSRGLILWLLGLAGCSSGARAPVVDAGAQVVHDAMALDSGDAVADGATESGEESGGSASFAQDVMPIFQHNCATGNAMCHGDPSVVADGQGTGGNREYLGPAYGAGDLPSIVAGLVGQPSFEDPSMDVVTAGSPETSFLIRKMEGELAPLAAACASGDLGQCGAPMPLSAQPLPQATLDTVRSWIAQGALDN